MARLPRNPQEAVASLGIRPGATVLAVGPAKGYAEALAEAVGSGGRVVVTAPPPDLEAAGNVEVVEALPEGVSGEAVVVWIPPETPPRIRDYPRRVADGGTLWVVLPRGRREVPAPVHEGDVKRALLAVGWVEDRSLPLSTDLQALRFRRRR